MFDRQSIERLARKQAERLSEAIVNCWIRIITLIAAVFLYVFLGGTATVVFEDLGTVVSLCFGCMVVYIVLETLRCGIYGYMATTYALFDFLAKPRDPKRITNREARWQTRLKKHKQRIVDYGPPVDGHLEAAEGIENCVRVFLFISLLWTGFPELAVFHLQLFTIIVALRMWMRKIIPLWEKQLEQMLMCPDGELFDTLCDRLFNSRTRDK
jgi:hypothetical protein